ncbi:MAG: hypothetical protein FWE62_03810, partial [Firmicutes bacterium]|nr:hypothetical protein [Bacillota bacterium]
MKREKLIKYGLAVALALMLALPFAALTGRAPSAGAAGESDEAVEILQTRISPDIGAGAPFSLSLTTETGAGTLQTHAGMWQISDGCETEGNAYKAAITQENYDGLTGVFKFQTPVTTNNTVVSANAIKFAQPIVIAESNGIDIKLRINAEYKSEFNNWFGAYLYGKGALTPPTGGDWTTFGHTGYRIYQEIPNTGWNILRIPKSELYKLADADDAAKISMIQFSMGCIASPTQAFYIAEIYPLEMTGPSGTLTGSYGYNYTNIGYSVTSNWYFNISEVTGAGAMGAASAYKTDFVCWGVSLTENVLVLDEPVKADEISLMAMIRVYAHLSDGTPYNTARGGVRLYPLDATGMDTASGYMIPAAIQQDTWVDLMLTKGDFAKLADADGWVRGIQFGCAVITGERNEFYNNHAEAYIMIEYLALYNEMPYKYHSDFVLTGYESPTGSSTLTQVSGFDNSSLHPVQYAWFLKDKEISLETVIDTANGFAYRMEITSWALNRSEKLLPFNRVVDIGDVEGMV